MNTPLYSFAEDTPENNITSAENENKNYQINFDINNGVLTITGTGHLPDSVAEDISFLSEKTSSLVIEDGITSIPDYAFTSFQNLESVTLPETLTTIGEKAFWKCSALNSVNIPDSVTEIGKFAFVCTNLKTVDGTFVVIKDWLLDWNWDKSSADLTIPDGVKHIVCDFSYFSGIKTITMPDSVEEICEDAFASMGNLTELRLSDNIKQIPKQLCYNDTKLSIVNIPEHAEIICDSAFKNCKALKNLSIPESVQRIEADVLNNAAIFTESENPMIIVDGCFFGINSATPNLELPEGVRLCADSALSANKNTETISLPSTLKVIPKDFVKGAKKLSSVNCAEGIKVIESSAFADCALLTELHLPKSLTDLEADAISGTALKLSETNRFCYFDNWLIAEKDLAENEIAYGDIPEDVTKIVANSSYSGGLIFHDHMERICEGVSFADTEEIYFPNTEENWCSLFAEETDLTNYQLICDTDLKASKGDVYADQSIDTDDAGRILKISAEMLLGDELSFSNKELYLADYNGDGTVDGDDATAVLIYYNNSFFAVG